MRMITGTSQDTDTNSARYLKPVICNRKFLLVILKIEPAFLM